MRKSNILLTSTICFLSFMGLAHSARNSIDKHSNDDKYFVEGRIYCDTCRVQFVTRLSTDIKDAEIRLECKAREGGDIVYKASTTTDEHGKYRIPVKGDYEEDICDVVLVKSPDPECSEIVNESHQDLSARVSITGNNGIISPLREANPLGFLKKKPLPECKKVLRELGFADRGDII